MRVRVLTGIPDRFGRVNTATARMHYAVGALLKDGFHWSKAVHHLSQATLLSYHVRPRAVARPSDARSFARAQVFAGHMGHDHHPEVGQCVNGLNDCLSNFTIADLRAAPLDDDVGAPRVSVPLSVVAAATRVRQVKDGVEPEAGRVRCSAEGCDRIEATTGVRFDRCAKCQCTKYVP